MSFRTWLPSMLKYSLRREKDHLEHVYQYNSLPEARKAACELVNEEKVAWEIRANYEGRTVAVVTPPPGELQDKPVEKPKLTFGQWTIERPDGQYQCANCELVLGHYHPTVNQTKYNQFVAHVRDQHPAFYEAKFEEEIRPQILKGLQVPAEWYPKRRQ